MYKSSCKFIVLIPFLSVFALGVHHLSAQTYGLKFKGINESLDNRTELNLTPNDYLTFQNEFEISFDYKTTRLYPNSNAGLFGYILRVINKENNNVDLLSSFLETIESPNLNLVIGDKDSIIQIDYPSKNINNWIRLKIKFNLLKDQVIFHTPDTFFVQEKIGFKKRDDFKIIFGANDFDLFKTSDVPTMSIKDIKITEQGKLKYHWPLNEKENKIAIDRLLSQKASVKNPNWLSFKHQIWQSNFQKKVSGQLMITADTENGKIFVVGSDELTIYSTSNNTSKTIPYKNKPLFLSSNFKPIYNSNDNKIYCYLVQNGLPHVYDIETGFWESMSKRLKEPVLGSNNRYFNRYYSASDNSIFLFGGYGRHTYNNNILKLNITKNTLSTLPTNDSIFYPKYLSGLGAMNDTIYILGGYGSRSGNQLINPQSYYDLMGYSIKDSTLFKKFDIPQIIDDMCVAHSMWFDESTRDYYALIYKKNIFNGQLRLIKGSLDSPEVNLVGSTIPYQFLDVKSTAGLLFMKEQKKLFSFTTYAIDSLTSQIKIYSINYPPNKFLIKPDEINKTKNFSALILAVVGIILFGLGFLYFRMRQESFSMNKNDLKRGGLKNKYNNEIKNTVANDIGYHLVFFGEFQVMNSENKNITKSFTPLLKELFLLIWLHTFKNNKGISSAKITEILWFDKTEKSAQNNRAVNLAKLRNLMSEMGAFKLSKKTGYWKCVFDESEIKSDYVDFLNLTSSKTNLTKQKVERLIEITKNESFLRNIRYDWLVEFKAKVSDIMIDTLIYYVNQCNIKKEADFIIQLAESIFVFDDTNEEAMKLKCKAQYILGKHTEAKETYDKFTKEYIATYSREYGEVFVDVIENED